MNGEFTGRVQARPGFQVVSDKGTLRGLDARQLAARFFNRKGVNEWPDTKKPLDFSR